MKDDEARSTAGWALVISVCGIMLLATLLAMAAYSHNTRLDYHRDVLCALAAKQEISITPKDCLEKDLQEQIRELEKKLEGVHAKP